MIQQGQVFKLKTRGADGRLLWAYRYRLEGRGSTRPQAGGFATREEAEKALRKVLDRLGPGGGAATMTVGDLVDEFLEIHQAEPVTIAKLRWLLGKATVMLGDVRLADLSPRQVYAWRLTVPEGHRFEATQALRQVLNRAVDWGLIDFNPAKRGIRNSPRRAREKRPFESWQRIEAVAAKLGPVYGPMVIFAADRASAVGAVRARTARCRPRGRRCLCAACVRERPAQAHEDAVEYTRGSAAGEGARRS